MNNPTISIVANFYKSERYISKLIKSVLNQTYSDWELICVNDCSPGKDAEIISKFINHPKSNGRIRLINNKTNLGISKSKKVGIDNAKGKYITFIDGDDWLAPLALEKMIEPAKKFNLDIILMNYYRIIPIFNYKWATRTNILTTEYNTPIYNPDLFENYYISFFGLNIFSSYAYWGKLYKLDVLKQSNIKFPQNDVYEDVVFNFRLFPHFKSMMFVDYCGYYWRWGGVSSGKKNNFYTYEPIITAINNFYKERKDAIKKYNYNKAYKWLLIELKNVFYSQLVVLAKQNPSSSKACDTKKYISKLVSDPIYRDLSDLKEIDEKIYNNKKIIALINQDCDKIYEILHEEYTHTHTRRIFKKVIHKLIYPFAKI